MKPGLELMAWFQWLSFPHCGLAAYLVMAWTKAVGAAKELHEQDNIVGSK